MCDAFDAGPVHFVVLFAHAVPNFASVPVSCTAVVFAALNDLVSQEARNVLHHNGVNFEE